MNFKRFIIFSFLFILFSSYAYAATPTTKISEVGRGDYVLLTGNVVRFLDEDEFVLRDDTGSIRVYIGYQNRMPIRPGEKVTVEGFVDFDLILEVYAWTITKEDGTKIEL
jgi:uncharacterized protein YdeI (BOF family)